MMYRLEDCSFSDLAELRKFVAEWINEEQEIRGRTECEVDRLDYEQQVEWLNHRASEIEDAMFRRFECIFGKGDRSRRARALQILALLRQGERVVKIAQRFGLSRSMVYQDRDLALRLERRRTAAEPDSIE